MRKKSAALAATMLVASGLTAATAVPAQATYCTLQLTSDKAIDIAWVYRTGGDCNQVGVRHFAVPSNGGTGYYTAWYWGTSRAQTEVARELQSAQGGAR